MKVEQQSRSLLVACYKSVKVKNITIVIILGVFFGAMTNTNYQRGGRLPLKRGSCNIDNKNKRAPAMPLRERMPLAFGLVSSPATRHHRGQPCETWAISTATINISTNHNEAIVPKVAVLSLYGIKGFYCFHPSCNLLRIFVAPCQRAGNERD